MRFTIRWNADRQVESQVPVWATRIGDHANEVGADTRAIGKAAVKIEDIPF